MKKYEQLAKSIIKNVGGKENIRSLTHCITRLRFKLKDESKANDDVLKNMEGVVTIMHSAGQYQVVIGNHVPLVYDEVCEQIGIIPDSKEVETKEKKTAGAVVIDFISNIMGPCINVLCASGMIKGILAILSFFNILPSTTGLYQILNGCSDALFYFFPILLGYTTASKLKVEPFVGLLIGAGLVYPSIQSVDLDVFGLVINTTYTSTILPVIFTVMFASLLYHPLQKHVPSVIKSFFVPMITLMIAMPIGFIIIGPIMNQISTWLGDLINAGYQLSPALAGVMIGGLYQIMVIFGVHGALGAIAFIQIAAGQPSFLGFMVGTTFAQTAVVFAIYLKTKNRKLKEVALPAVISGIFGVTEPAIYGVTLPRIKFFVISCIGAALTGGYLGLVNTQLYALTGLGIFTIPGFIGGSESPASILFNVIVSLIIGMAFSFIVTYVLYKDDEKGVSGEEELIAPIHGSIKSLDEAEDKAFASGSLGDGILILPTEGKVVAPADGTVTTLFPTLHAIGITTDKGVEVLIHVGINTVQLEGKGFTPHVAQGDHVKKGQLLLDVDLDYLKKEGYSTETPIIITNSNDLKTIDKTKRDSIQNDDKLLTVSF